MITAIDSSVLWAIVKIEPHHEKWIKILFQAATQGPLIISPVAFAELAASTSHESELTNFLTRLAITFDPISPAAAYLAGQTFKQYRLAGGPRQPLVPDFLIAAHAQTQANRLATVDRGYLRKWFPNLILLSPDL